MSSQLGFNLSFLDTAQGYQDAAVTAGQQAALFGGRANIAAGEAATAGTVTDIGKTIFQRAGGFKTIFGS